MSETMTTSDRSAASADRVTRPFWQMVALLRMELTAPHRNWTATALCTVRSGFALARVTRSASISAR